MNSREVQLVQTAHAFEDRLSRKDPLLLVPGMEYSGISIMVDANRQYPQIVRHRIHVRCAHVRQDAMVVTLVDSSNFSSEV